MIYNHKILVPICSLMLGLSSCSENNGGTPSLAQKKNVDFSIGMVNDFLPQKAIGASIKSLNTSDIQNEPVLIFPSEDAYQRTLKSFKAMSDAERLNFFSTIGFSGVYSSYTNAELESEHLFEIEDSIAFLNAVKDYRKSLTGVVTTNPKDTTDLTPILTISKEDQGNFFLGNKQAVVVVDGKLRYPSKVSVTPKYTKTISNKRITTLNAVKTVHFFKDAKLVIRNGKYRSSVEFGKTIPAGDLVAECLTWKKKLIFKKYYANTSYNLVFTLKKNEEARGTFTIFMPDGIKRHIFGGINMNEENRPTTIKVESFKASWGNAEDKATFNI